MKEERKAAIIKIAKKRVFPAFSDEEVWTEISEYAERYDSLEDTPNELVSEYMEKYDLEDLSDL
jgi:hypothetical protein